MMNLLQPNLVEGAGMALAALLLIAGIVLIRRAHPRRRRTSTPHEREMEAQRQKAREQLPPGQL